MNDKNLTYQELIDKVNQLEKENIELKNNLFIEQNDLDTFHRYQNLYQLIPFGYSFNKIVFDSQDNPVDYIVLEANDAFELHTGLPVSKIIGKPIKSVNPNIDLSLVKQFANVAKTGIPFSHQYYSNAFQRHFQVQVTSPKTGFFTTLFTDITQNKQNELLLKEKNEEIEAQNEEYIQINEELHQSNLELTIAKEKAEQAKEKFRIIADFTYDWEYWQGENGEIIYMSPSCENVTGYSLQEFLDNPLLLNSIIYKPDYESFETHKDHFHNTELQKQASEIDFRIIRKDGALVYINHICRPVFDNSDTYCGRRISNRDITERKKAEEDLKQSESLFRLMAENSTDMIARHDTQGNFLYVSPACRTLLGFEPEELIGHSAFEFFHPDDIQEITNSLQKIIVQPISNTVVFRIRCKNDSYIWFETTSRTIFDPDTNEIIEVHASSRDVTNRKLAEDALALSKINLTAIIENTSDSIWAINSNYEITYINGEFQKAFHASFGVHLEIGINLLNSIPEYIRPLWKVRYDRALNNERFIFEDKIDLGSIVLYIEVAMNPIVANGKVIGASFFSRDITQRKQAETLKQEAFDRLQKIAANVPGVVYQFRLRPDGSICFPYASDACHEIFRVSPESIKEDGSKVFEFMHPDDFDKIMTSIHASAANLTPWQQEYRMQYKDGSVFTHFGSAVPQKEEDGSVLWHGFISDITHHKQIERMLQDIIDKNPMSIQLIDKESYTISVNPAHTKLFGAVPPPDYCLFTDPILWDQGLGDLLTRAKNGEIVYFPDFFYNAHLVKEEFPDMPIWIQMLIFPLNDSTGKPERYVLMHQDITFRKRAEEELEYTKALLNAAFEQSPVPMALVSVPDHKFKIINKATEDFLLIKAPDYIDKTTEQINITWKDLMPDGKPFLIQDLPLPRAIQGIATHNMEILVERADGKKKWELISGAPIFNANEKLIAGMIVFQDITERKQVESMLRDIIDKNPMSIQIVDEKGYTLNVNEAHTKLFGAIPPADYSIFNDAQLKNQGMDDLLVKVKNGEVIYFPDIYYNAHDFSNQLPDKPVWIRTVIFSLNNSSANPDRYVLMHEDITHKKHADEKLRESEFRLSRAEKVSKSGNWKLMLKTKQMIASEGACIIYGAQNDTLSLNDVQSFPLPEYRPMLDKALVDLISKNIPYNLEFKIKRHGDNNIVDIYSIAEYDKENNIVYGVIQDITDRKKAEQALSESNELNRTVVANTPIVTFVTDDKGIFTLSEGMGLKKLGLQPGQVVGMSVFDVYYEYPSVIESMKKTLEGEPQRNEIMVQGIVFDVFFSPVFDENGKVKQVIGVSNDITERKQSEDRLRENEEKLSTLFKSMTEMVVLHEVVFDENGKAVNYRITDCNDAFTEITGINKVDAIGKLATEVYQVDRPPYLEEFTQVGITGKAYEYTTFYAPMDKHFMISVVSPQKNRFATITTDITAIQQIQEAITNKNKELENYLYVASHDLRSPLVNIQGFSQRLQKQADSFEMALADSHLSAEKQEFINKITKEDIPKTLHFIFSNVTKMDTLINGLLQISRTGRIKMTIKKVDMNQLLKTIIATLNFQISEVSAQIKLGNLPDCYGDEDQLNQLFTNIIGNALKYKDLNRELIIDISGQLKYNKIIFHIKDTGIGIAPRHLDKIWDVFFRVNSASSQAGEGIGLSLAKRIADKHKGKIWAESEEGIGSEFFIELQKNMFSE